MAGLVPAIHVFNLRKDMDPQTKSGDDAGGLRYSVIAPKAYVSKEILMQAISFLALTLAL